MAASGCEGGGCWDVEIVGQDGVRGAHLGGEGG
jgi:hypothetical protein